MTPEITVYEAKIHLDNDDAVLIDVREPFEYHEMNIPSAKLIPMNTDSWDKLPVTSAKKIIVHCRSGKRSAAVCMKLLSTNPQAEVYNMAGGILAWYAAGFPVDTTSQP
jgi:rhodanese-related sulfurtransferase